MTRIPHASHACVLSVCADVTIRECGSAIRDSLCFPRPLCFPDRKGAGGEWEMMEREVAAPRYKSSFTIWPIAVKTAPME